MAFFAMSGPAGTKIVFGQGSEREFFTIFRDHFLLAPAAGSI